MPTFEEARSLVLAHARLLEAERVPLSAADGRIAAEAVDAPWDLPRADNSAMDGFAVRAGDCRGAAALSLAGYAPAGGTPFPSLGAGQAVRIMTGAALPEGADAVVPLEEAVAEGDRVAIPAPVREGAHVRYRGEDVRAGVRVVSPGDRLRPPEISLLASLGRTSVSVYRRARVAVLATGDELVEAGSEPSAGAVIDSNSPSLSAAVREAGAEPVPLGIARDDRGAMGEKVARGLAADALVTSAGVSVGDRDLVREVLAGLGARELFWKVDIRPGSPFAFAVRDGTPVFCLPGNPVSALVTFEELVRPALRKMMGDPDPVKPLLSATLAEPVRKKPGRVLFLRVRVEVRDGRYVVRPAGKQETGYLTTLRASDGIVVLPAEASDVPAGETVRLHILYPRC